MRRWIVTAEPISARTIGEYLEALFGPNAYSEPPRNTTAESMLSFLDRPGDDRIILTDLSSHLTIVLRLLQFSGLLDDCLYLRPRVLAFAEGLSSLAFPSGELSLDTRRMLILCDALLTGGSRVVQIDLEDLVFSPDTAVNVVAAWLRRDPAPASIRFTPPALGSVYAVIQNLCRRNPPPGADLFPLNIDIPFHARSVATLLLQEGWSGPEASFVWSDAASSRLRIPTGQRDTIARLGCSLIEDGILLEAIVDGRSSCACVLNGAERKDRVVLVLLKPSVRDVVEIELVYDRTVRPCDSHDGSGDTRSLAVALQSIRFTDRSVPRIGRDALDWSEVIANDTAASLLSVSRLPRRLRDEWLTSAVIQCRDTARIMGCTSSNDDDRGHDGSAAIWQHGLKTLLTSLNDQGAFTLVVGPRRIADLLESTVDVDEIRGGSEIYFLIGVDDVRRPMLDWLHHHDLLLVTEGDCVIAAKASS